MEGAAASDRSWCALAGGDQRHRDRHGNCEEHERRRWADGGPEDPGGHGREEIPDRLDGGEHPERTASHVLRSEPGNGGVLGGLSAADADTGEHEGRGVNESRPNIRIRAARHAALGDPVRLAIVDELALSDRAPVELRRLAGLESNLLAHHLGVLDRAGLVTRQRSSGDGRRRYVHLERTALGPLAPGRSIALGAALFVCTHNSARSQLAAALWKHVTGLAAVSAGTFPAERVHPGAIASARRAGVDMDDPKPGRLDAISAVPALAITVCDRAHEELDAGAGWLHWSIRDPVPIASPAAFDAARDELWARIDEFAGRAT